MRSIVMASTSGSSSAEGGANGIGPDPKLEALMERIRAKPNQKSWPEIIKNLRMAISDKRHFSEVNDKQLLQKYLDILQKAIKVNGHMSLLEKLSSLSRGVGLKYTSSAPYSECFLSTDMFYVEIKVDVVTGKVQDVAVVHDAGDRSQCPEVAEIVNEGKFDEFTEHLEGLMSIYKINGDKRQKSKCFMALQSLEKDLNLLAQLQSSVNGVSLYIHKTPLGIVQPRIGGLPMKLIFFVAPIDLVRKGGIRLPMTVETIMEKKLGHSCTIGIEPSNAHKLQTVPLMSISKNSDGKSLPSFSGLSNQNSCSLPAWFTLSLVKPVPVSLATMKRIRATTGIDFGDVSETKPILELIVNDVGGKEMRFKKDMPFFVSLPNQEHCYYVTGCESEDHMKGTVVTSIPFVHPTHVPKILQALRQQIAFNTLVGMLVRPKCKLDLDSCLIFEMCLISLTQISVLFEHPILDRMATVEFEFSDLNNVKAQFMSSGGEEAVLSPDENLSKIVNKTYSVPITMRSLMKKATEILSTNQAPTPATPVEQVLTPAPVPLPVDIPMETILPTEEIPQLPIPMYTQPFVEPAPQQNGSIYDFDPYTMEQQPKKVEVLDHLRAENVAKNPMLASLLDQDNEANDVQPVLPTLLSDPLDPKQKQRKHRKRKAEARSPGSSSGRSPKRKFSEDDHFRSQESSFDMDSNDGFDLGQQVPFPSGVVVPSSISQSQTGGGNVSNAMAVRREDASRLKASLESMLKQDTKPRGELVALLADDDQPAKVPAIGQTTRRMTSREEPHSDALAYQHIPEVALDPDIFTTDDGSFTPTDFISSKDSKALGSQPDLDFNPDLLSDSFPDAMNENSEDMDLDACDANAFGVGMNKAVAKLTTPPKGEHSPKTNKSPKLAAVSTASLASQVPAPIPTGVAPSIHITEKKDSKKEKKSSEEFKPEYRPMKKSNKPLSARIGEPKPDLDALDYSALPIKEIKTTSLKSLLKESLKEKKEKEKEKEPEEEKSGEFFTATATGGTSLVISAKSSPSSTSKESLKISVKKDRIKKSSKEDDFKRKKESSLSKDKAFKKRRLDDEGSKKSESSKSGEIKPIKIRTSGGKVEIQSHSSSSSKSKESEKKSDKPEMPKVVGPDYLKHILPGAQKLTTKLPRIPKLSEQGKPNLLDKSTINPQSQKQKKPQGSSSSSSSSTSITVSKSDSKLMTGKTPTIKLKPLVMPSSVDSPQQGAPKTSTSSTKTPVTTSPSSTKTGSISSPSRTPTSGTGTPPLVRESTPTPPIGSGTPPPGASSLFAPGKGKSPVKARSLSDVINKLKANKTGPGSGGEDEEEKDDKKKEEKKSEKKVVKEKSSSSSTSSKKIEKGDDGKFKIKAELKKAFSSSTGSSKSSSSSKYPSSSKSSSSSEKKSETKKPSSSPSKPSNEKMSPSPSVKREEKKEKPKEEKEKDSSSAKDPRLEPKTEKPRPSSAESLRPHSTTQESPKKQRDSPKLEEKPVPAVANIQSPDVKESPDSPDESLVIDLPLTPSSAGTKTIPMERSSPLPGKESPVPPSPKTQVTGLKTASPLVRTSSPLVRTVSPLVSNSSPAARTASPTVAPASQGAATGTPTQSAPQGSTPAPSALPKGLPITSPVSNPSPCPIDDDLMNEAVMGCAENQ